MLFSLHLEKSVAALGEQAGKLEIPFNFCIRCCPLQDKLPFLFLTCAENDSSEGTALGLHNSHCRNKYFEISKRLEVSPFPQDL